MNYELFIKPAISLTAFAIYFVFISVINSTVNRLGRKQKLFEARIVYIKKFFMLLLFSIFLIALAFIWGIDIRGVFIFASSFFALVGVALFASWSVLSNITSSIIIFFSFPYKIGDNIRIIDGENSVKGEILDITLFYILIKDEEHHITTYPNNLAIQKPITMQNNRHQH